MTVAPQDSQTQSTEMFSQSQQHCLEADTEQARIDEEEAGKEKMLQDKPTCNVVSDTLTEAPPSAMAATQADQECPLDASRDLWLKFDDIIVSPVDWEEVKRESFGGARHPGNGNTSAYCLMYISTEAERMWEGKGKV